MLSPRSYCNLSVAIRDDYAWSASDNRSVWSPSFIAPKPKFFTNILVVSLGKRAKSARKFRVGTSTSD
jgi:hypothetical protein